MKHKFITIKIWKKTLSNLRLIAGVKEKSMASILDEMVEKETPKGLREEPVDVPSLDGRMKQEA